MSYSATSSIMQTLCYIAQQSACADSCLPRFVVHLELLKGREVYNKSTILASKTLCGDYLREVNG